MVRQFIEAILDPFDEFEPAAGVHVFQLLSRQFTLRLGTPALVTRMLAALNRSIETLIKFHRIHAKKGHN